MVRGALRSRPGSCRAVATVPMMADRHETTDFGWLVDDTPLLAALQRAQQLGFIGPGEVSEHVRHALGFVEVAAGLLPGDRPHRGVDLGSGAGLPGLVLAAAMPAVDWMLVDSMQRRTTILAEAVATLGLGDTASVWCGRAEDLGREPAMRGACDLVVARSFGPPAVVAECAAPLLRVGGWVLVSEPPGSGGERWPAQPLSELGLVVQGVDQGVMVLQLRSPTPDRYPRRVGVPVKRPLF
jgi:16S rRNA (guanine527-N7)-methyltransferase